MKATIPVSILLALTALSCSEQYREADAWGNFEAREVIVSSETTGKIITFSPVEGDRVAEGDIIAIIDTTVPVLQINEIIASRGAVYSKLSTIDSQNEIYKQQIANLNINLERVASMLKDDAATQKQYDDIEGQVAVLQKQVEASLSQKTSVRSEMLVLDSRMEQVKEQLNRCKITAPSIGTIIQKYAEKGEITTPGKPLLKIADLETMRLKVYISGGQLAEVKVGEECIVRIDNGNDNYYEYTGTISSVSDKAEFTPKIIQTKEERVSMVYAVTIDVMNDGKIKSGMPGEALFRLPG